MEVEGRAYTLDYKQLGHNALMENNGDRPTASNVALLFTDGASDHEAADMEASSLRQDEATIVVVGIGGGVQEATLLSIADNEENLFSVSDFGRLKDNTHEILGRLCDGEEQCIGVDFDQWNSTSFPVINDCPRLSNPIIKDYDHTNGQYFIFECQLNYTTLTHSARVPVFTVTFLFGDAPVSGLQTAHIRDPSQPIILHQNDLTGNLGKNIRCEVATFWADDPWTTSPNISSRSYWAGIALSHDRVDVFETSLVATQIIAYSTLPIVCPTSTACSLAIKMTSSSNSVVLYQRPDKKAPKDVSPCQFEFLKSHWHPDESLAHDNDRPLMIHARSDVFRGGESEVTVTFGYIVETPGGSINSIWKDYNPEALTIAVHQSMKRTCRSTGDPQITTFDGRYFTTASIGYFSLIRSDLDNGFEVQVNHFACRQGEDPSRCSITCAVAVREAGATAIFDVCDEFQKPHILTCPDSPEDIITITQDKASTKYMIKTQKLARIKIELLSRGLNLYIRLPASYQGKVNGMCGNYNGNPNDDLTMETSRDAKTYQAMDTFVKRLRVGDDHNLFMCKHRKVPTLYNSEINSDTNFCQCEQPISFLALNSIFSDNGSNQKCGLAVLESDLTDVANPTDSIVRALIPGFLKSNAATRPRRSADEPSSDLIDFDYNPWNTSWKGDFNSDPPAWGTYGINEDHAVSLCESTLKSNKAYQACSNLVKENQFEITLQKCVSDLQRSGDRAWALNKVYEFQDICVENFFSQYNVSKSHDPTKSPLFQQLLDQVLKPFCPPECKSNEICQKGSCKCVTGCEPPVPLYGPWSEFSNCSKDCDYGLMTRTRSCIETSLCADRVISYNQLCNQFNCPELDSENKTGTELIMQDLKMKKFVQTEEQILEIITVILNNQSHSQEKQLCEAVEMAVLSKPVIDDDIFWTNNTRIAQGYPKFSDTGKSIRVKIFVTVNIRQLRGVCELTSRMKRATDEIFRDVEPQFVTSLTLRLRWTALKTKMAKTSSFTCSTKFCQWHVCFSEGSFFWQSRHTSVCGVSSIEHRELAPRRKKRIKIRTTSKCHSTQAIHRFMMMTQSIQRKAKNLECTPRDARYRLSLLSINLLRYPLLGVPSLTD